MRKQAMLCSFVLMAGCAQTVTPNYDIRFGDAVREARLAMTIDPSAGQRGGEVKGIDGRAAQEGIKLYQESFRQPPPVTNVINIGGAIGGNGGGGGGK
ncbi:hypothetical protein ACI48D_21080 [Massilia sp. LXY-6]|uniref:hypothetical protein n=1 Tax=Massilia sp. LXY-6 TaxID=3379823 RepID=UPI003EE16F35